MQWKNLPPPRITNTLSQSLKVLAAPSFSKPSVVVLGGPAHRTLMININEMTNGIIHQIRLPKRNRDFFCLTMDSNGKGMNYHYENWTVKTRKVSKKWKKRKNEFWSAIDLLQFDLALLIVVKVCFSLKFNQFQEKKEQNSKENSSWIEKLANHP